MKSILSFEELKERQFIVREGELGGTKCYLVFPQHMGVEWTEELLPYRSSIWTEHGEPISLGFKKFFNYSEQPELTPDPTDEDIVRGSLIEKLDGSCLITSAYKGEVIHRTRGTFNAELLSNGTEIEYLKIKYPKVFDNFWILHDYSLLYEWTTPENVIVLNYGTEPELRLIGAIDHKDYSLVPQSNLDSMAKIINVERPIRYEFETVPEMIDTIKQLKGKEGIVCYYNDEQTQKKLKADEYLKLHRFKSNATWKNIVNMYFDNDFHSVKEYRDYVKATFDWECFQMVECFIGPVVSEHFKVKSEIIGVRSFVSGLEELSQKDAASIIIENYKGTPWEPIAFCIRNGKEISTEKIKNIVLERVNTND